MLIKLFFYDYLLFYIIYIYIYLDTLSKKNSKNQMSICFITNS